MKIHRPVGRQRRRLLFRACAGPLGAVGLDPWDSSSLGPAWQQMALDVIGSASARMQCHPVAFADGGRLAARRRPL